MTDEERFQIAVIKSLEAFQESLHNIQGDLLRLEATMLKREDLHPSVHKPHSIEEWEQLMAGEAVGSVQAQGALAGDSRRLQTGKERIMPAEPEDVERG